jgi:hypothetical protein
VVNVPAPVVHVHPPKVLVNVAAPPPAEVRCEVAAPPAPIVNVNVPQQEPPVVHVHIPEPKRKSVEFERDKAGNIKSAEIVPEK